MKALTVKIILFILPVSFVFSQSKNVGLNNVLQTNVLSLFSKNEREFALRYERLTTHEVNYTISMGFLTRQDDIGLEEGFFEQEYTEVYKDGFFMLFFARNCWDENIQYEGNQPWEPAGKSKFRLSAFYIKTGLQFYPGNNEARSKREGWYFAGELVFGTHKYLRYKVSDKSAILSRERAYNPGGIPFLLYNNVETIRTTYRQTRSVEKILQRCRHRDAGKRGLPVLPVPAFDPRFSRDYRLDGLSRFRLVGYGKRFQRHFIRKVINDSRSSFLKAQI